MNFKTWRKAIVIFAIILIPLIYSFFYLYAFWDPYSRLQDLPVAFVNEDKGADINGSYKNIGQEISDEIKKNNNLKWVFTDMSDAKYGLFNRKYYALVNIPKDFSEKISTADKEKKVPGVIVYEPEEKRNFLAGQVLNRVMIELKEKISGNISKQIVGNMVVQMKKVPNDLMKLQNGLAELEDGQKKFNDGVQSLNSGINELKSGSNKLLAGSGDLADGAARFHEKLVLGAGKFSELDNGSKQFAYGLKQMSDGVDGVPAKLNALERGSGQFAAGLGQLKNGVAEIPGKMETLEQGSGQFAKKMADLKEGSAVFSGKLNELKSGTTEMSKGIEGYSKKMQEFNSGVNEYTQGIKKAMDANKAMAELLTMYVKEHPEAMQDKSIQGIMGIMAQSGSSVKALDESTEKIKAASTELYEGSQKLTEVSTNLNLGVEKLQNGYGTLAYGASQLSEAYARINNGIKDAAKGMKSVSLGTALLADEYGKIDKGILDTVKGIGTISKGAGLLAGKYNLIDKGISDAADSLKSASQNAALLSEGTKKLDNGLESLNNGMVEVSDGSRKLYENSGKLLDGIKTAHDGVSESIDTANGKLKAIDRIDEYVSEPVELKESKQEPVPDYGTGFAPYFMSLSLFVGAIMMFFGIYLDPEMRFKRNISKLTRTDINFVNYSLIGAAQAVVLAFVLQNVLHLHVKNIPLYYLVTIIVSLTFIAIVQFFIVNLKEVGKFLSILLLILQLTATGGTFPMEMVPKFFNIINPYLPMTFTIYAFKEVISGIDYGFLLQNLIKLGVIALTFLIASQLLSGKAEREPNRETNETKTIGKSELQV